MTFALFDYQKRAADIIAPRDHSTYLADEMGVGKSATAIEVAKRRKVERLLILCPSVGKLTWVREFRRWWPEIQVTVVEKPADVRAMAKGDGAFILSYSLLSMSKSGGFDYIAEASKAKPFEMSVLDEAHALKNPKAIRTRAVLHTLKPILGWCLPMSGTPTPNHSGELFPILYALFPEVIRLPTGKLMKQFEFEECYCDIKHVRFGGGPMLRQIAGSKNIEQLRARLAPYILRRRKREVLPELPEMLFDTYPVPVSGKAMPIPDTIQNLSDDDLIRWMSKTGDEHIMRVRHQIGVSKLQGSIEAIIDTLEGCNRKVLVFGHHQAVIQGARDGLLDYNPVVIDGSVSTAERDKAVEKFLTNPNCRVFIGNILAAGTSITLIGPGMKCSDVFFIEADWSPGNNVQAASRVHRVGQDEAVQVWFMTAHGTLDDRIQDILARKAADFSQLFG